MPKFDASGGEEKKNNGVSFNEHAAVTLTGLELEQLAAATESDLEGLFQDAKLSFANKILVRSAIKKFKATETAPAERRLSGLETEVRFLLSQGEGLKMTSADGLRMGNFVTFRIKKVRGSGEVHSVELMVGGGEQHLGLKIDSGSDRDLLLPLDVAERLDLGDPIALGFKVKGVSGTQLGVAVFPAQVHISLEFPNGRICTTILQASALYAKKQKICCSDTCCLCSCFIPKGVTMLPPRALIGHGALHKMGMKVDFKTYTIYELAESEKGEDI